MEKKRIEKLLGLMADMEHFSKADDIITREIRSITEEDAGEELHEDSLDLLFAARSEPVGTSEEKTEPIKFRRP